MKAAEQTLPHPPVATAGAIVLLERDGGRDGGAAQHLAGSGWPVQLVAGLGGVVGALAGAPAALVLDLAVEADGAAALQELRAWRAGGLLRCPVVVISDRDDIGARLQTVRAGADAHLVRSDCADRLVETLHWLLCRNRAEPYRVVIIDDDQFTAQVMAISLRRSGLEATVATRIGDVLDVLRAARPEVVLVDIHMPECNGIDLAAAIRQVPGFLHVPLIFVTSEKSPEQRVMALRSGGNDFLIKPVDPAFLLEAVTVRAEWSRLLGATVGRLAESEGRFRAVAQTASDAIIATDEGGTVVYANASAVQLFGVGDVVGRPALSLVAASHRRLLMRALRLGAAPPPARPARRITEVLGQAADGRTFPMEVAVSPWQAGGRRYFTGIIRDITERKRTEETLRRSEERYHEAVRAGKVGVWEWSPATDTVYLAPTLKAMVGFAGHRLGHRLGDWMALTHPDDRGALLAALWDLVAGRSPQAELEHRMVHRDGSLRWFVTRAGVAERRGQQPVRLAGASTDITELKETQRQLELARERADAANAAKTAHVTRMVHELRTPLNAVLGYTQLLQRLEPLTERQRTSIGHVYAAGTHMLELTNEALDLARIEAGIIQLIPETLDIALLCDDCLALTHPEAERYGITLVERLPGEPLPPLRADSLRVKQVLLNLLSNAIKYGGRNATVTVAVEPAAGDRLRIAVTDTGPGIPADQLGSLFTPFQRLGAAGSAIEGSGLGLSITRLLVEAMGGEIGVASTVGAGTTFWFELPVAGG